MATRSGGGESGGVGCLDWTSGSLNIQKELSSGGGVVLRLSSEAQF